MDKRNKNAIDIYNAIAEDYSKKFDLVDEEEDLVFLNSFVSHIKPKSYVVDIGCGTGFSSGFFVKKGMTAEGSDLSSSMIAIAQRNYPEIKFSVSDMRKFKPVKKADAVWAGYSLFHFDQKDFERTVENIKSYLKQTGIFGLVMQEGFGEVEAPEPFLPGRAIYIHLYTENELTSILERHGFKILGRKRKEFQPGEFAYNKLLIIAQLE